MSHQINNYFIPNAISFKRRWNSFPKIFDCIKLLQKSISDSFKHYCVKIEFQNSVTLKRAYTHYKCKSKGETITG